MDDEVDDDPLAPVAEVDPLRPDRRATEAAAAVSPDGVASGELVALAGVPVRRDHFGGFTCTVDRAHLVAEECVDGDALREVVAQQALERGLVEHHAAHREPEPSRCPQEVERHEPPAFPVDELVSRVGRGVVGDQPLEDPHGRVDAAALRVENHRPGRGIDVGLTVEDRHRAAARP